MSPEMIKLVVFVPETHADAVRRALGEAGAGLVGNYSHCSFSVKGTAQFMPLGGSKPTIGSIGKIAEVIEDRIETVCDRRDLDKIIAAAKKVHPYEEPVIEAYPLI